MYVSSFKITFLQKHSFWTVFNYNLFNSRNAAAFKTSPRHKLIFTTISIIVYCYTHSSSWKVNSFVCHIRDKKNHIYFTLKIISEFAIYTEFINWKPNEQSQSVFYSIFICHIILSRFINISKKRSFFFSREILEFGKNKRINQLD